MPSPWLNLIIETRTSASAPVTSEREPWCCIGYNRAANPDPRQPHQSFAIHLAERLGSVPSV